MLAMNQVFGSLKNVQSMPDSDRSTLDSYFDVVCKMISSLSCVINLFVVYMRVFGQYSINNLVIGLEITIKILLLDKI